MLHPMVQMTMKAHLKSKNKSWSLGNDKKTNLYFNNYLGCVYQINNNVVLILNKKQMTFRNSNIFDIVEKKLNNFYLVGYLSYNFNDSRSSKDYRAIFNIYTKPDSKLFSQIEINRSLKNTFSFKSKSSDQHFIKLIRKAKKLIEKGEIYQINLTRQFLYNHTKDTYPLFLNYFKSQPVEYGAFIDFFDHSIVSGSMELFLQKKGIKVQTKPIKGTSDNKTKNLDKNSKERAENLMIVDLMRNDLSKICEAGTVKVNSLFNKKKYTTLTQLESTISGKLKNKIKLKEIFNRTMPPGSVTGTPKVKSIEIISKMENHTRGPYCGAVGYISPNNDFCFSVGIRLSKISKNKKTFYTGSGIVWDSDPKKENIESHLKARAFLNTLSSS